MFLKIPGNSQFDDYWIIESQKDKSKPEQFFPVVRTERNFSPVAFTEYWCDKVPSILLQETATSMPHFFFLWFCIVLCENAYIFLKCMYSIYILFKKCFSWLQKQYKLLIEIL